jgi:hypothetical protein
MVSLVVSGCAGSARPARPTPVEESVAERLDAIAYRGGEPASVAGVTLERLASGAVRAVPLAGVGEPAESPADDLRIEAAVRGAISTDPMLSAMDLDVDVDGGVVRLAGDLASAEQAARALDIALDTPGVIAAESRCAWLSRAQQQPH